MSLKVQLLKDSYALIDPRSEDFSDSFYRNLFTDYPQLESLFANTNMYEQQRKFSWSLIFVVQNCLHPKVLQSTLAGLGANHVQYGVLPEHYPLIGNTLLKTLGEYLGEHWTADVEDAWVEAYHAITEIMLEGANCAPETLQLSAPSISEPERGATIPDELSLSQATQTTPIATTQAPSVQSSSVQSSSVQSSPKSFSSVPLLSGVISILGTVALLVVLL